MHFELFIFLFRSYSFGIETINTFILMYPYSIPVFSDQKTQNPTPRGDTYLYGVERDQV